MSGLGVVSHSVSVRVRKCQASILEGMHVGATPCPQRVATREALQVSSPLAAAHVRPLSPPPTPASQPNASAPSPTTVSPAPAPAPVPPAPVTKHATPSPDPNSPPPTKPRDPNDPHLHPSVCANRAAGTSAPPPPAFPPTFPALDIEPRCLCSGRDPARVPSPRGCGASRSGLSHAGRRAPLAPDSPPDTPRARTLRHGSSATPHDHP